MLNSWNIELNCLGGGIQYLLPTMIDLYAQATEGQETSQSPHKSPR